MKKRSTCPVRRRESWCFERSGADLVKIVALKRPYQLLVLLEKEASVAFTVRVALSTASEAVKSPDWLVVFLATEL